MVKILNNKYKIMKQIKITKYEGNTHYSVYVIDSFGKSHHIGYESTLDNTILAKIEQKACDIWASEQAPCPKQEALAKAIKSMIDIDIKNGITPSLD